MKITIVGGGTAGWLSALYLLLKNKSSLYDISLVESDDIPIVGAGEGSTFPFVEAIRSFIENFDGFDEKEFIKECNVTHKLGIECRDWNSKGDRYFESLQQSATWELPLDLHFALAEKYSEEASYATLNRILWDKNLSAFKKNKKNNESDEGFGFAYHFDAYKVGEYFKKIALKNGIKLIKGTVVNTNLNSNNGELKEIILEDGKKIKSDFWIDCTGFKRVLINSVGGEWVSYSDYLPINSALTYIYPFEDDKIIQPSTLAWAMPNGWMWQIPTTERYGCGYCYSDKFVSKDEALKEMEKVTNREIKPLRDIKFDSGRLKEVWIKNVMAIGLSSSFLEPLEATSIHTAVVQLKKFINYHLSPFKGNMRNKHNIKSLNENFNAIVDEFRDLIQLHYITKRQDTPFWKYVKNNLKRGDLLEHILDVCKYKVPTPQDFPKFEGSAGWGVWSWVLAGNKLIPSKIIDNALKTFGVVEHANEIHTKMIVDYNINSLDYYNHTKFVKWVNYHKNKR